MKQQKFCFPSRILFLVMGLMLSLATFGQSIKGTVKDATGEAIIGATVQVVGQQGGAVTDFDGNFELKVKPGTQLKISYVGMQTQTLAASDGMIVTLKDDSQMLEQVVVIGYGVAKKNDLTGSVTAIKPDDKNHGLQTSASDMLQGKVAGVNVTSSGGSPGAGATIKIRGGSSLNASNDPLIVIDGLAMDSYGVEGAANPLSLVNPADIESFTVLKDASATAIYGSRASNGVIIITTKRGRKNQAPTITYNGNVSVSAVTKKLDVLTSSQYVNKIKELSGYATDEEWLASSQYKSLGYWTADGEHIIANTDWQDQIYRTAVSTDHNITVSGGIKNMPYRVSLGYTNQQGVLKTSDYNRYTASISLNPSLLDDHLTINFNAKGMYSKTNYAQEGAIGQALSMDPTKPVTLSSGYAYGAVDGNPTINFNHDFGGYFQYYSTVEGRGDTDWLYQPTSTAPRNPVSTLNSATNTGKSKVFMGNAEFDYKIHGFEDLHLHANAGWDIAYGETNKEYARYNYDHYYYGQTAWNEKSTYNLSLNMYAQYIKDINKNNHFDVMAGYEWQHFHVRTDNSYYGTYPSTNTAHAGEKYDASDPVLTPYASENYLVSFFGRFNYSLCERYLLTFTLRDDGSSRFAKGHRWGLFPAAALAWKIKDESFLKDNKTISDLKLRLGWGMTGQQEGISDYGYLPLYSTNYTGAYYNILGNGVTYRPDAYNTQLTWEKTTTYNAGIDFGFFDNKLTGAIDYYYRKTTDLINNVAVAAGSNFRNKVTSNIGALHNEGIELSLVYHAIRTKDWTLDLNANATHNTNKIDKLVASNDPSYKILHGGLAVGDSGSDGVRAYCVDQAVNSFYVYQQVYDTNGQPIRGEFVDRNGDGQITASDRYFYKNSDPDVTLGFGAKVGYKNWDLGITLRASIGNYVYNGVEASNSNISYSNISNGGYHNILTMELDKNWQNIESKDALSDYFIQNASFLKCDNITIGYSFENLFKGAKFKGLRGRVYATAQNVFTITQYKGLDPEVSGGYDGSIYPRPFVGILGLTLTY